MVLEAQKFRHLAVAVLSDPSNAMARGLMGLVEYGGKWRPARPIAERLKADVKHADLMAEYGGRRVRTPVKTDAQYKLAGGRPPPPPPAPPRPPPPPGARRRG